MGSSWGHPPAERAEEGARLGRLAVAISALALLWVQVRGERLPVVEHFAEPWRCNDAEGPEGVLGVPLRFVGMVPRAPLLLLLLLLLLR